MEDRNGLVVDGCLGRISGTAEREAALAMIDRQRAPGIEADNTDRRQALRRMGFCPEPAGTKRYAAYRRRRSSHQERQEAQDSH